MDRSCLRVSGGGYHWEVCDHGQIMLKEYQVVVIIGRFAIMDRSCLRVSGGGYHWEVCDHGQIMLKSIRWWLSLGGLRSWTDHA